MGFCEKADFGGLATDNCLVNEPLVTVISIVL